MRNHPSPTRGLREARGWSQAELGKRCGLARVTINRLERGTRGGAAEETLFAVADVFGCSVDVLRGRAPIPPELLGEPPQRRARRSSSSNSSDERTLRDSRRVDRRVSSPSTCPTCGREFRTEAGLGLHLRHSRRRGDHGGER